MNQFLSNLLKQIPSFISKWSYQRRAKFVSSLPYLQPCSSPMYYTYTTFQTTCIQQTKASMRSISCNPAYLLLGTCKNLHSLLKIHSLLTVHGLANDLLCLTKLVSLYGSFGYLGFARKVFDRIPNPDLYSYKVMIRWYFLNELHSETISCYKCLRNCLREADDIVFSIVLKACCELRAIDEGKKVHCHIVKAGSPDSFVLTSLVDVYAKCGEINSARNIFDEIDDRNVVSWTSLITGYVQNDCSEEGLILFNRMRESLVHGNQFTLGSLLTGCGKLGTLHQGKWFHGYVIKAGINLVPFLATALLDMYIKCGSIKDARSVFDEACTSDDLVSWTAMIVGHTQCGQANEALKLFTDKRRANILPNSMTIANVLSACSQLGDLSMGRSVHCLATLHGLEDVDVKHALIDMYAKCNLIHESRYIFDSIHNKNVIAWNSIISGYAQNGYAFEALKLFHRMPLEYVSPDAVTLVSVISACSSISDDKVGSSLHAFSIKEGLSNTYVGTTLLNFYAKCGDNMSARKVFDEMGEKNEVTWSSMIRGYGMHGDGEESVALFNNMLKENVEPNEVIFTAVLSACSHTGNVGEGWKHFTYMCREYNFLPTMKHYACMVDVLARAGKLEEAVDFIEKMPIQPDMSVLGAFVHGCSLHSQFELGEIAAKRMLNMHPNEACYYVLLCKLYSLDGRWEKADEIRNLMKERGLSKSPGWSSSETNTCNQHPSLQVNELLNMKFRGRFYEDSPFIHQFRTQDQLDVEGLSSTIATNNMNICYQE